MAVELVKIVNPNGRTGYVPRTHPALRSGKLRTAASQPADDRPVNFPPEEGGAEPLPARNASTEAWREYATTHGMSPEDADAKSRDELVAHFTSEED